MYFLLLYKANIPRWLFQACGERPQPYLHCDECPAGTDRHSSQSAGHTQTLWKIRVGLLPTGERRPLLENAGD